MKIYNKINKVLFITAIGLSLVSCMDDDQDYPAADKPMASFSPITTSVQEGETIEYTITLDKAANLDSEFKIVLVEGEERIDHVLSDVNVNAAEFGDSENGGFGYSVTIPRGETTGTFTIDLNEDIFGDSETIKFMALAANEMVSSVNADEGRQVLTIDIQDKAEVEVHGTTYVAGDLGLELDWEKSVTFEYINAAGNRVIARDLNICGVLDYDLFIELPAGTVDYQAATGDCPEVAGISASAADGTYILYVDYYDDGGYNPVLNKVTIPIELTASIIGGEMATTSFGETFEISIPDSADEGGTPVEVATITKSGSSFTITNSISGEVVLSN